MDLKLVIGNHYTDASGILTFNNDFDASPVKRICFIENRDTSFVRAWQGHKIEQRWFTALRGSFEIRIITIDDWETPSLNLQQEICVLKCENLMVLQVPNGCVSRIQALEENSKLMVMADYLMGEIEDEYRYDKKYFEN